MRALLSATYRSPGDVEPVARLGMWLRRTHHGEVPVCAPPDCRAQPVATEVVALGAMEVLGQ